MRVLTMTNVNTNIDNSDRSQLITFPGLCE